MPKKTQTPSIKTVYSTCFSVNGVKIYLYRQHFLRPFPEIAYPLDNTTVREL
jgi:hypothetical protein